MWVNEDKDNEEQNTALNPAVGGGAGGTSDNPSNTANVSSPAPMKQQQAPNRFASVQDYLKTNRTQGQELGQNFLNKTQDIATNTQKDVSDSAANVKNTINTNQPTFDQGLIDQAKADPTKITGNESTMNSFLKQWNNSYGGPSNFENTTDYTKASEAANKAGQTAEQLKTLGGREQILQDQFGVYGQGNKGLDQALLQTSDKFGDIQNTVPKLNSVQDYLKAQSAEIQNQATAAQQQAQNNKEQFQGAFTGGGGIVNQFKTGLDTRLADTQATAAANTKEVQDAIAQNKQLSDKQLGLLGITKEQYSDLLNKAQQVAQIGAATPEGMVGTANVSNPKANISNLKDYLTLQNPSAQITRENVASAEDYARDAALAKLTGGSSYLNQGQVNEAGKASTDMVGLDYDSALKNYLTQINSDAAAKEAEARRKQQQADEDAALSDAERTAKREQMQSMGAVAAANPIVTAATLGAAPVINKAANKVGSTIKKAFCFDGDTLVDIGNGVKQAIKDIKLGSYIDGGVVFSTRQSITEDGTRYNYKGVTVTGSHAVLEDGEWKRVEDTRYAVPINGAGIVYSLVTSSHRIFIDGIEFADEHETDMYETLTMDQSIQELNRQENLVLAQGDK